MGNIPATFVPFKHGRAMLQTAPENERRLACTNYNNISTIHKAFRIRILII